VATGGGLATPKRAKKKNKKFGFGFLGGLGQMKEKNASANEAKIMVWRFPSHR
jgi:hypothetical protein